MILSYQFIELVRKTYHEVIKYYPYVEFSFFKKDKTLFIAQLY